MMEMKALTEGEAGQVMQDLNWFSPGEEPFVITGFPWLKEEGHYRRLRKTYATPLPPAVDGLADNTAGGQIRFRTNSGKLAIRVKLAGPADMYHMPATGQCGFDCYIEDEGEPKYFGTTRFDPWQSEYEHLFYDFEKPQMRSITLYFPLYQGVEEVRIGLEDGAEVLAPAPLRSDKRVILYGTSILQGGCANRPGMAYPNILSRTIPLEFINLGFSGSGLGEPEVAAAIAEIERPGLYVLDYEANCPSTEHLKATLPAFIRILRGRHPDVPILVVSKIKYAKERFIDHERQTRLANLQVQMETVERLRGEGDREIHFFDGSALLNDDYEQCTVDGVHPTDLGFLRMAENLAPALGRLLFDREE